MPETTVRYHRRNGSVELPIRFVGPDQNFVLKTDPISFRLSANIPPRLLDLLEIASAVFCADSSVSRGTLEHPRHGKTWRRDLDFTFAVRDIAFWNDPDIERLLRDCIEFMTGDQVSCAFVETENAPPIQSYLDLAPGAEAPFQIDDVVLFSGGLDSLAGTIDTLRNTDRRIALVTHRSAPKTIHQQDELMDVLRREFGDRLLWIPVRVHRKARRSSESTQRSRSLLFSALGMVVTHMLRADRINFFENGIVSQNLYVARPIVGTLATRTTHPRTLSLLEDLLSQVAEAPLSVKNPFQWLTKTDVVGRLEKSGYAHWLPLTVSCNHTFKRKSDVRHCGACTQCLDRRFAVLANGLGNLERQDDYAVDVLYGVREREDERALASEWVRHARRLSEMTAGAFQGKFVNELLRIARPFGNRKDAFDRCHEMHQRHGSAVTRVLSELSSTEIAAAPAGSLAATLGGNRPNEDTFALPTPAPPHDERAMGPNAARTDSAPLEIMRDPDGAISVIGLQNFGGVHARLIGYLLDVYLEDRKAGLRLQDYHCRKAREIGEHLGVTEDYVRTEVRRIREQLAESWSVIRDTDPPKQILIETVGKKGYRLEAALNVVSPDQGG